MIETFGLIDADAFYVSCERAFQPALEGRPVVVLSEKTRHSMSSAVRQTVGAITNPR